MLRDLWYAKPKVKPFRKYSRSTWRNKAQGVHDNEKETKNASEAFLLTFDFRKKKTRRHKAGWVEVGGKRIFDVVV